MRRTAVSEQKDRPANWIRESVATVFDGLKRKGFADFFYAPYVPLRLLSVLQKDRHDSTGNWPHKNGCPLCCSDAYVGLSSVECSSEQCANFKGRV